MQSRKLPVHTTICKSHLKQSSGLMWRWPKKPFAYIFPFKRKRRVGITMWFVFYPIDIILLDENNEIIEVVEHLKPFTNYFSKNKIKCFIELPSGSIKKYRLKSGSNISWTGNGLFVTEHLRDIHRK